jgi:riboflavin kinase/FMN adenylyltransferase
VTFDPHPRTVLGGGVELLATPERRLELLAEAGVADVLVLRFDEQLAALSGEEFAETMLRGIGAETVAAGATFRFGRGREGDLDLLERLGFDVRRVPLAENVSSSRIRELLHAGQIGPAAGLLGRPPEVEGIVVRGDGRGRELGFPTANLDVPAGLLVPPDGVYAGWAARHRAAVSIGTNPHFDGVERRVEAYLLDFDGDLYGKRLLVELWAPLREQRRFESLDELVAAIGDDVERVRASVRPG